MHSFYFINLELEPLREALTGAKKDIDSHVACLREGAEWRSGCVRAAMIRRTSAHTTEKARSQQPEPSRHVSQAVHVMYSAVLLCTGTYSYRR